MDKDQALRTISTLLSDTSHVSLSVGVVEDGTDITEHGDAWQRWQRADILTITITKIT